MAEPFLAEIRIVGFNFAPRGWYTCDGQILSIAQNTALFSLLGTTYGGNGTSNFGLPNFQGKAPMHWGQGPGLSDYALGETGGSNNVTLLSTEMPNHGHGLQAFAAPATTADPSNALPGTVPPRPPQPLYGPATSPTTMAPNAVGLAGSSTPHNNMQPYQVLNFVIAAQGVYPPRS